MLKKSSRHDNGPRAASSRKYRWVVLIILALSILGTTMLARVNSRRQVNEVSAEVLPSSFIATKPSREMIFAGTRMVASEDGYSIFPTYQSFAGNGSGTPNPFISVTAPSGVAWTATKSQSWITIISGSNGAGNGTVTFSVAVNSDSAIRSGTITVNDQVFTVYQGINFTDVPTGHMFYDWIGRLAARGITVGCGGGNFCPDQAVTQEQMSAFVMRALGMPNPPFPPSQRFADVTSANPFYSLIEQMGARGIWTGGIWNGCPAGNYCPGSAVRRDEMAAIVIRGRGEFNPPTPGTQRFSDVPPTNHYYNFVDRMAVLGITSGCATGLYCPDASVTRGQMAVFLVRAFNL